MQHPLGKHSSSQFMLEMESIRNDLLHMGGLVEKQVDDALDSFLRADHELAHQVLATEPKVDSFEKHIDEECARVLALRQPAAIDLRTLLAVTKCVADLERIGDKAAKIASHSLELNADNAPSLGYIEIRHIGQSVKTMLHAALDAFARFDAAKAIEVAVSDEEVDAEYHTAMRSLMTFMMEDPRSITQVMKVMSVLRALERVGDHSRNFCEQVVYLTKGKDVRHISVEQMRQLLTPKNS